MTNRIKAILTALIMMSMLCATAAADLPATFDWRDVNGTNYMTPAKEQGMCGSCWAFAILGAIESNILIENNVEVDLSEQYFVSDCWWRGSCDYHYASDTMSRMLTTCRDYAGAPLESCIPYLAVNSPCYTCDNWEDGAWHIDEYGSVTNTEIGFKSRIINNGPIIALVYSDEWYYPDLPNRPHNLHSIVVAGWNDSEECWIVKNSDGTGWVDNGYGKVSYGDLEKNGGAYYVSGSYKVNWNEWDDDCVIADAEVSLACWHWCTNTPINGHLITDAEMSLLVYQWSTGDVC